MFCKIFSIGRIFTFKRSDWLEENLEILKATGVQVMQVTEMDTVGSI